MLWRNHGDWNFEDVAAQVGLDQDNSRFSFAASWEDYDQDGDLDLYVANDFGRNCLYQNQGIGENKLPFFRNVAPALEVEDSSAGMSASWGDFNRDGWMDLYVSNISSSAGNRITYQSQFQDKADEKTRATFQRMPGETATCNMLSQNHSMLEANSTKEITDSFSANFWDGAGESSKPSLP